MIRYADDFVMGFSHKGDADRVMKVIIQRFAKYKLTLHPEKTKLVAFNSFDRGTFDFLGFTHYWGKSIKGRNVVKRKTSSKKFSLKMQEVNEWFRRHRHGQVGRLIDRVNKKLQGHYNYYGITGNLRQLNNYYYEVRHLLLKWLNRRGGKRMNWEIYAKLLNTYPLVQPRIVHNYV